MDSHSLIDLLRKYRQGRCSVEEIEQLNRWYHDFDLLAEEIPAIPVEKLTSLRENIECRLEQRKKQKHYRKVWRYVSGVAAILVIALSGVWYLSTYPAENEQQFELIHPGQHYARLQLSDGTLVELDSTAVVKTDCGVVIKKDTSAILDYSLVKAVSGEIMFNTIQVPLGGEYCVRLSDGTQIWMNSGSELKFPIAFNDELREVELSGEAYFEVTKSTKPFIVKTFDMDVQVLGTSFNVSAYGNDDCVQTTLVDGKVLVSSNHDEREYTMTPGYAWIYTRSTSRTEMKECDTDLYTSWMKGIFKFRDLPLEDIMKKLNRWYGCSVRFESEQLKQLRFSGAAEKDRPVEYLLEMIRAITPVDFEIKGASVIVKNK